MIDAATNGTLTLQKLEAMTAVCSVGLDMIAVPGDTTSEAIFPTTSGKEDGITIR